MPTVYPKRSVLPFDKNPVEAYLEMGVHSLSQEDIPYLTNLFEGLNSNQYGFSRLTRRSYRGWIHYELADIESQSRHDFSASKHYERAVDSWRRARANARSLEQSYEMKLDQQFALGSLRLAIANKNVNPNGASRVHKSVYLASLARAGLESVISSPESHRFTTENTDTVGVCTELLFAAILLHKPETKIIPFCASPRQEHPAIGHPSLNPARDFNTVLFDRNWRQTEVLPVQIKTSYSDEIDASYDKNIVSVIYGDSHLHVEGINEAYELAAYMADTDKNTPVLENKIGNAKINIFEELGIEH